MPTTAAGDAQRNAIFTRRFRTELCASFVATGRCKYHNRCMFAHGPELLRTPEQNVADGLTCESAIRQWSKTHKPEGKMSDSHHAPITTATATTGRSPTSATVSPLPPPASTIESPVLSETAASAGPASPDAPPPPPALPLGSVVDVPAGALVRGAVSPPPPAVLLGGTLSPPLDRTSPSPRWRYDPYGAAGHTQRVVPVDLRSSNPTSPTTTDDRLSPSMAYDAHGMPLLPAAMQSAMAARGTALVRRSPAEQ